MQLFRSLFESSESDQSALAESPTIRAESKNATRSLCSLFVSRTSRIGYIQRAGVDGMTIRSRLRYCNDTTSNTRNRNRNSNVHEMLKLCYATSTTQPGE